MDRKSFSMTFALNIEIDVINSLLCSRIRNSRTHNDDTQSRSDACVPSDVPCAPPSFGSLLVLLLQQSAGVSATI